ncbi:MAG TPA: hypothetical protein V6C86_08180 [Oculatellaceae cyanobacterium]
MSGLRVSANKGQQPLQIWWLLDELKKRKISQVSFAERLGISVPVLTGRKSVFPADKVAECMHLLENWNGPLAGEASVGGRKGVNHPWHGPALTTGKQSR